MPFVSKELKENTDPGMGNANMNDIDRMSSIYSPYILRISSSLKSRWRCKLASAEAPFLRDLKTRMIFLETSFHGKTCFEDCSRECFFFDIFLQSFCSKLSCNPELRYETHSRATTGCPTEATSPQATEATSELPEMPMASHGLGMRFF